MTDCLNPACKHYADKRPCTCKHGEESHYIETIKGRETHGECGACQPGDCMMFKAEKYEAEETVLVDVVDQGGEHHYILPMFDPEVKVVDQHCFLTIPVELPCEFREPCAAVLVFTDDPTPDRALSEISLGHVRLLLQLNVCTVTVGGGATVFQSRPDHYYIERLLQER